MISSGLRRPGRHSGEHVAEDGHVVAAEHAGVDSGGKLPAVTRLLPVVAEDPDPRELRHCDLRLARPVGAEQAHVLSRPQGAGGQKHFPTRRHRHEQIGCESLGARRRDAARLRRDRCGAGLVEIPDERRAADCGERPRRRGAVDPGADHRGRLCVLPPQHVGRDHRRSARAERRDGPRVEQCLDDPRLGVREHDEAAHGRQAAGRVAGERRHPLEQRVTAAERGHRAEVPSGVVRDVELRLHRPVAARVGNERIPDGVIRRPRRDRRQDVASAEERNHRRSVVSAELSHIRHTSVTSAGLRVRNALPHPFGRGVGGGSVPRRARHVRNSSVRGGR